MILISFGRLVGRPKSTPRMSQEMKRLGSKEPITVYTETRRLMARYPP